MVYRTAGGGKVTCTTSLPSSASAVPFSSLPKFPGGTVLLAYAPNCRISSLGSGCVGSGLGPVSHEVCNEGYPTCDMSRAPRKSVPSAHPTHCQDNPVRSCESARAPRSSTMIGQPQNASHPSRSRASPGSARPADSVPVLVNLGQRSRTASQAGDSGPVAAETPVGSGQTKMPFRFRSWGSATSLATTEAASSSCAVLTTRSLSSSVTASNSNDALGLGHPKRACSPVHTARGSTVTTCAAPDGGYRRAFSPPPMGCSCESMPRVGIYSQPGSSVNVLAPDYPVGLTRGTSLTTSAGDLPGSSTVLPGSPGPSVSVIAGGSADWCPAHAPMRNRSWSAHSQTGVQDMRFPCSARPTQFGQAPARAGSFAPIHTADVHTSVSPSPPAVRRRAADSEVTLRSCGSRHNVAEARTSRSPQPPSMQPAEHEVTFRACGSCQNLAEPRGSRSPRPPPPPTHHAEHEAGAAPVSRPRLNRGVRVIGSFPASARCTATPVPGNTGPVQRPRGVRVVASRSRGAVSPPMLRTHRSPRSAQLETGQAPSTSCTKRDTSPTSPTSAPSKEESKPPLKGTVVAYNKHGRPIIVRQEVEDSGKLRTVVENEDGTRCAFGDRTIVSLLNSSTAERLSWTSGLSNVELRGLVYEIGQRLGSCSRLYEQHRTELEKWIDKADFLFFGLTETSTQKELDRAYRKLAKLMHPDKNGGTDEAKRRFQQMKERYEKLRPRCRPDRDPEQEERERLQRERQLVATYVGRLSVRACAKEHAAIRGYYCRVILRALKRTAANGFPVDADSRDISSAEALPQDMSRQEHQQDEQEQAENGETGSKQKPAPDLDDRTVLDSEFSRLLQHYEELRRGLMKVQVELDQVRTKAHMDKPC